MPLKSEFASRFPSFEIEEGFSEEDPLWTADYRETDKQMQVRASRAFDRVFSSGGASETCELFPPSCSRVIELTPALSLSLSHPDPLLRPYLVRAYLPLSMISGIPYYTWR